VRLEIDATKTVSAGIAEYGVNEDGTCGFHGRAIADDTYAAIIQVIRHEQIGVSSRDDAFDAINPASTTNHIVAEWVGDRPSLYANGAELFTERDASLSRGDVGLIAITYADGSMDMRFDNFVVNAP